jgi:plastocyanin
MRRSTALLSALAASATLALAGCGDTTADEGAGSASGEAAECETVTVEIPEFAFAPDPIEVSACDSVAWENTHTQAHTSTGNGDQQWSTGNIPAGATSDPVTFEGPGELTYICALHPFMTGTVLVS